VPTYQYACRACDERLEVVQKFSDEPLTECAVCGGRLRKIFSPVGIVFKGSGFYRTDSRNGSAALAKDGATAKETKETKPNGASDGSSSSSDSGSAAGGSAEKKPAEKKSSAPAAGAKVA
jgi:putative FmdB family regulatory protein